MCLLLLQMNQKLLVATILTTLNLMQNPIKMKDKFQETLNPVSEQPKAQDQVRPMTATRLQNLITTKASTIHHIHTNSGANLIILISKCNIATQGQLNDSFDEINFHFSKQYKKKYSLIILIINFFISLSQLLIFYYFVTFICLWFQFEVCWIS